MQSPVIDIFDVIGINMNYALTLASRSLKMSGRATRIEITAIITQSRDRLFLEGGTWNGFMKEEEFKSGFESSVGFGRQVCGRKETQREGACPRQDGGTHCWCPQVLPGEPVKNETSRDPS